MSNVPFGTKSRQPIIPLSMENIDLARDKEFVFDYRVNKGYVKNKNGDLIDFANSSSVIEYLETYIANRPTIILDCLIIERDGEIYSIRQSFIDLYNRMVELDNKQYYYATSDSDGGAALLTKKLDNALKFVNDGQTICEFDGSKSATMNFGTARLFNSVTGGEMDGEVHLLKTITLANDVSFGTALPSKGVEGQIFVRLTDNA